MKIIIATAFFPPEPIVESQMAYDIATRLSVDNDVTVLKPRPTRPRGYKYEKTKRMYPFKVIELQSYACPKSSIIGRTAESFDFGRAVAKYIENHKNDIDVVYANLHPFWGEYVFSKRMKKLDKPFVTHVQDIYPEPLVRRLPLLGPILLKFLMPLDKYVLENADNVIVIGPKIGDYLVRTRAIDGNHFKVIYNWQDESRFANLQKSEGESGLFTFMFCGSLSSGANLEYIADSFIEAHNDSARLVFAGSGNLLDPLKSKAKEHPDVNIDFMSAPFSEIGNIQSTADVLVMPLRKTVALRCFPSKFPAYLFSHKPVLACVEHESDVADCIDKADCGWIVGPEDKATLVELFKTIPSKDRSELDKMGENAYQYSQQNLTRSVNLSKICDIIVNAGNKR